MRVRIESAAPTNETTNLGQQKPACHHFPRRHLVQCYRAEHYSKDPRDWPTSEIDLSYEDVRCHAIPRTYQLLHARNSLFNSNASEVKMYDITCWDKLNFLVYNFSRLFRYNSQSRYIMMNIFFFIYPETDILIQRKNKIALVVEAGKNKVQLLFCKNSR